MRSLVIQTISLLLHLVLLAIAVHLAGKLIDWLLQMRDRRHLQLPGIEFILPSCRELPPVGN